MKDKKDKRKIKLELLDPVGEIIEKVLEFDYYNIGYTKPPEEYPEDHEPMKKARYMLTIGERRYFISRDGEILKDIDKKDEWC